MKMRSDSPFAVLTEEERMLILEASENSTMEQLVEHVEMIRRDLNFSIPALRRFVRRLKEEGLRAEVEAADESMEENAKQEWKRQELEDARSALRLLPRITEILMGTEGTAEERLARARTCLLA